MDANDKDLRSSIFIRGREPTRKLLRPQSPQQLCEGITFELCPVTVARRRAIQVCFALELHLLDKFMSIRADIYDPNVGIQTLSRLLQRRQQKFCEEERRDVACVYVRE